jgi:transposase
MNSIRYVGLDVHKETIAVAATTWGGGVEDLGEITNNPAAVAKLTRRLHREGEELQFAYEAGPTGYPLYRQLTNLGYPCLVAAPSLIPQAPGDRVKTDRRDAAKLARFLRSGDLTACWVPDQEHEALRNLVRSRYDAKQASVRAQNQLALFLLRLGLACAHRNGSAPYWTWLNGLGLAFGHQTVLEDYRATVIQAQERVSRLDRQIAAVAEQPPYQAWAGALQTLRGVKTLTAMTVISEAGDLHRFAKKEQFASYAGLTPSEHSSGASRHLGGISKTGSSLIRFGLVEAAHTARLNPTVSKTMRLRQQGQPAAVVALALEAQTQLHARFWKLSYRVGYNKAVVAVARELAEYIWKISRVLPESQGTAA